MRDYDELLNEQRGPFTVIVDKTWEDLSPRDQFEDDDIEGTAEDLIYSTLLEAKKPLEELKEKFANIDPECIDAIAQ